MVVAHNVAEENSVSVGIALILGHTVAVAAAAAISNVGKVIAEWSNRFSSVFSIILFFSSLLIL